MVFSLTLVAAARQDSRSRHVSTVMLTILLATALSGRTAPLSPAISGTWAAVVALIAGVVWASRAGLCGGADPIGIAALALRHGSDALVWIGAGCMVTALGAALTGESRPPLFPALLIAHTLSLWEGAA
jgi:hypothetical protein